MWRVGVSVAVLEGQSGHVALASLNTEVARWLMPYDEMVYIRSVVHQINALNISQLYNNYVQDKEGENECQQLEARPASI